jgi:site-specific recombinase XerD
VDNEALLCAFRAQLVAVGGLSEKTARNYVQAARALLVWLECERPGLTLGDLRPSDVEDYLVSVASRRLQPSTRYGYVYGIKAFFTYLSARGLIPDDPARLVRPPRVPPAHIEIYSPADAAAMLSAARRWRTVPGRQRYAMITMLRFTGLRSGELRSVRLDQVDLSTRRLEVVGKGSRPRVVPVPPVLAATLDTFVSEVRPALPDSPLLFANPHPFVEDPQRAVSEEALEWAVQRAGRAAGVGGRHYPHRFRHTFATELIRSGVGLALVQRILGHVSINSTLAYAHLADADLRDAVDGVYGEAD